MRAWLLRRLVGQSTGRLRETELDTRFPEEFQRAVTSGLLVAAGVQQSGRYYDRRRHRLYELEEDAEGQVVGYALDDASEPPIHPRLRERRSYTVDWPTLLRELQIINGLDGPTTRWRDGLWHLGHREEGGERVDLVLALPPLDQVETWLRAIPSYARRQQHRWVVLVPDLRLDYAAEQVLWQQGVFPIAMDERDPWRISADLALARPGQAAAEVVLTSQQEAECTRWGFKSKLPIVLTGRRQQRSTNIVEIGGQEVPMTLANFLVFLQLVIALFEREDGWIRFDELRFDWSEEAVAGESTHKVDQHLERVRFPLRNRFGEVQHTDLIEGGERTVRLSTHPACVQWNEATLLEHPHRGVKTLTRRLGELRLAA